MKTYFENVGLISTVSNLLYSNIKTYFENVLFDVLYNVLFNVLFKVAPHEPTF